MGISKRDALVLYCLLSWPIIKSDMCPCVWRSKQVNFYWVGFESQCRLCQYVRQTNTTQGQADANWFAFFCDWIVLYTIQRISLISEPCCSFMFLFFCTGTCICTCICICISTPLLPLVPYPPLGRSAECWEDEGRNCFFDHHLQKYKLVRFWNERFSLKKLLKKKTSLITIFTSAHHCRYQIWLSYFKKKESKLLTLE